MDKSRRGLFVVMEGSDGSGKTTQFNLLMERLKATGYDVECFDFPQYNRPSSTFVKQYLEGKYGPADQISPYTASLFYALDRFDASTKIEKALSQNKIVISNRYVGSNMAHQGSKFENPVEQRGFFVWEDNLEYELLGIPRPDISFFLRIPAGVSKRLIEERAARTKKDLDEHERNFSHLKKALATYDVLCQLFPKDFKAIECTRSGNLLSIAEISDLIWNKLQPMLPVERPNPSHSVVVTLDDKKEDNGIEEISTPEVLRIPFHKSSLLLRTQIERLKPLSEPLTSWSDASYQFYTPGNLSKEMSAIYKSTIQNIAEAHEALESQLTALIGKQAALDKNAIQQLLLAVTPMCALSPFELKLRISDVAHLCSQLLTYDNEESQWAAKQIYLAARRHWPRDFQGALESKNAPESINHIIAKLANEHLPQANADSEGVRLLETVPRQEFDLLAETIYPMSNLPLAEITEEVSSWPYLQKYESLRQTASAPGVLERVRYKMDVISDQISLYYLAKSANLRGLQVQALTPRYGFDLPAHIEDAGLEDLYSDSFDDSLKLFSHLQAAEQGDNEQYATLFGHKVRWQFTSTAKEIHGASEKINRTPAKKLYMEVIEKVGEVHPLLWEIIAAPKQAANNKNRPLSNHNRVKPSRQRAAKKRRK